MLADETRIEKSTSENQHQSAAHFMIAAPAEQWTFRICALLLGAAACAWMSRRERNRLQRELRGAAFGVMSLLSLWWQRLRVSFATANATTEFAGRTHEQSVSRLADATATTKFLLAIAGTDADHYAIGTASTIPFGVTQDEPTAGDAGTLRLLGKGATQKMTASEAMTTPGVDVFAAASGKIALTGSIKVGVLLSAAAADGSICEVLDCLPVRIGARILTAAATLTAAETGTTCFLNLAGGFTVTLPALKLGLRFKFIVMTAPTTAYILLSATNDNIVGYPQASLGSDETGNGNAAGDQVNFVANVSLPSDCVELECDGVSWQARATCKATGAITITG